jgi:HK97 family phage major capsid protein
MINSVDHQTLSPEHRKALSSFVFGSNGFILQPEMSSRILSCLVDETDVAGLMQNITISGPSIKFLVDNVDLDIAAWACQTTCFANNPQPNLQEGLGELEIKPETLRYIVCASRDILEDASVDIESWMLNKVNRAFRRTISSALISGTGVGMPIGILNSAAGIPICDTAAPTAAGQFTWQDLVMLKWQVPMQWQGAGKYLMNQHTFGLTLTMSDANGRPIMIASPLDPGQFVTAGTAVQIVTQMPDVAPGATPVAYGNWNEVYMIVNRKAITMQQDPYSAGFCVLFKFEGRVGGAVICPNAARLLRIK